MTRETRIGLLVGLAFIIMFGLVLSELMNSEMPSSATAAVEDNIPPGETASAARPPARTSGRSSGDSARQADRRADSASSRGPIPLSAVGSSRRPTPTKAPRAAETYIVRSGDTLISIAREVYGPEHGDKYGRIFQANRHILPDECTLSVGQKLVIPSPTSALPAGRKVQSKDASGAKCREMDLGQLKRFFSVVSPARTYVVREGDTLSSIAADRLGDSSRAAVMKIFDANKDVLTSADDLAVGVTLRIPR